MGKWHELYITDKTGQKFFKTTASPMATPSEHRNMMKRIEYAKAMPLHYKFLDIATAEIVINELP